MKKWSINNNDQACYFYENVSGQLIINYLNGLTPTPSLLWEGGVEKYHLRVPWVLVSFCAEKGMYLTARSEYPSIVIAFFSFSIKTNKGKKLEQIYTYFYFGGMNLKIDNYPAGNLSV